MSITINNPVAGIPLAGGKLVNPSPVTDENVLKMIKPLSPALTETELQAQIAKQNAAKVHTTYRVNGELVAIYDDGGFTMRNAARVDIAAIYNDAFASGLSGDARKDYIAEKIGEALKQLYGAGLKVEYFENADAPTRGEIIFEFNGGRSGYFASSAFSSPSSNVSFSNRNLDSQTLAALLGNIP